nr:hypothetical protein [uncultured Halomonas sp.]
MIRLPSITIIVALVSLLSLCAQAQENSSSDTSKPAPTEDTKKMKQALEEPTPVEDGAKQAPGGKAKPEENWFGCNPDENKQQQSCDQQGDAEKGKEKDENKTS